ncbi:MAG: SagB/ThcOx family dehydrogenase [Candidatus Hydrothermarchaeales archaeon]
MKEIKLPEPKYKGDVSVEEAILRRRSIRDFSSKSISIENLSQILWAAQGITGREGGYKLRAAPSAGALYPVEIYVVMEEGVYHYDPKEHMLHQTSNEDSREKLCRAALSQEFIAEAPVDIVITAVFERTRIKYGERDVRYVYAEAGHVSQNIYLQCVALDLGTVTVGAFHDERVQNVLGIPSDHMPIYIMPVGYERR